MAHRGIVSDFVRTVTPLGKGGAFPFALRISCRDRLQELQATGDARIADHNERRPHQGRRWCQASQGSDGALGTCCLAKERPSRRDGGRQPCIVKQTANIAFRPNPEMVQLVSCTTHGGNTVRSDEGR
jgi:hypothetical protein